MFKWLKLYLKEIIGVLQENREILKDIKKAVNYSNYRLYGRYY